jgi:hypothetical protein
MSNPEVTSVAASDLCWETMRRPAAELLDALKVGPFTSVKAAGQMEYDTLLSSLRRERLAKPAIFVGTGTCGLGAGAAKTLEAVRNYLKTLQKDVVEVGCVGLCSEEPILDVQLPGRARFWTSTPSCQCSGEWC